MTKVTFPNGLEFSDDGSAQRDMLNGGHAQHFFPLVNEVLKVGQHAVNSAAASSEDRKASDASRDGAKQSEEAAGRSRDEAAASARQAAEDAVRVSIPPLAGKDGRSLTARGGRLVFEQPIYHVGEIRMWTGRLEDIEPVWGPGWHLADGTRGTADLRDRFIVGAGHSYRPNDIGGANFIALNADQMPSHAHGVHDPGHVHGAHVPGHAHGVVDPGHAHTYTAPADSKNISIHDRPGLIGQVGAATGVSATGIGIAPAGTNIQIVPAGCGIGIHVAGGNAAHENRPPYYALCLIQFVG
ncbi:MAG: hypothetical protein ACRYHA_07535, partial [Janthinobacterium lividum]